MSLGLFVLFALVALAGLAPVASAHHCAGPAPTDPGLPVQNGSTTYYVALDGSGVVYEETNLHARLQTRPGMCVAAGSSAYVPYAADARVL